MTTPTAHRAAGTAQALPLLFASCMSVLGAVLLTPEIPQLLAAFPKDPPALVLLIISGPALMIAIFAPFAGQIADRVGRKNLLVVTMIVYAFVGTAPLWLPAVLPYILVSRLLVGVCEAAIMTSCTTLIGDYFSGDRRNRYFGLQSVFTTIAATIFILIGGILGGAGGWRTPFLVYGISIVIAIAIIVNVWEPTKTEAALAAAAAQAKAPIPWRILAAPLVVTLFGGFAFFVVLAEPSQIYATLGLSNPQAIGPISAAASIATAVLAFLFARLARLGAKVLLPIAYGAMAVGYLIVWAAASAGSLPLVIVGVLVASAGTGLLLPTLVAWAVGRIPFLSRGRSTGVWTSSFFLGQFLTPLIIAAIQGAISPTTAVAVAVGIVGIACAIVAVALAVAVRPGPIVSEAPEEAAPVPVKV